MPVEMGYKKTEEAMKAVLDTIEGLGVADTDILAISIMIAHEPGKAPKIHPSIKISSDAWRRKCLEPDNEYRWPGSPLIWKETMISGVRVSAVLVEGEENDG